LLALTAEAGAIGAHQDEEAPEPTTLEQLVDRAGLIVHGPVRSVRLVSQSPPRMSASSWPGEKVLVAEVGAWHTDLGPEGLQKLSIVQPAGDGTDEPPLQVGDELFVFLRPAREITRANERTRGSVANTTGEGRAWRALEGGLWRIDPLDKALVTPSGVALPQELVDEEGSKEAWLHRWIRAEIERTCPRVEASLVTTGPRAWSLTVGPDGEWISRNGTSGILIPEQLERFRAAVQGVRRVDWSVEFGGMRGPDEPFRILELKTSRGVDRAFLFAPTDDEPGEVRIARARIERLWLLLPDPYEP